MPAGRRRPRPGLPARRGAGARPEDPRARPGGGGGGDVPRARARPELQGDGRERTHAGAALDRRRRGAGSRARHPRAVPGRGGARLTPTHWRGGEP